MSDMPPEPPPTHEQVIEHRLVECGLDAQGILVKYEDYLQSIEVVIEPTAGATAEHFQCIYDATGRGYEIVTFRDGEMYGAYSRFVHELLLPQLRESSEARLRERGLLDGVPRRADFANLKDFAIAIERHAGYEAGEALGVTGEAIELRPPLEDLPIMADRSLNLMAITAFASSHDRVEFFSIGNEAFATKAGQ